MAPLSDKTLSRNFQNFTQSVELLNQYRTALFPPDYQNAELFDNIEIAVHAAAELDNPNQLTGAELMLYLRELGLADKSPFAILSDAAAVEAMIHTANTHQSICAVQQFQDFVVPIVGARSVPTLPRTLKNPQEISNSIATSLAAGKNSPNAQLTGASLLHEEGVASDENDCNKTVPVMRDYFRTGLWDAVVMNRGEMPVWKQNASLDNSNSPTPQPPLGGTSLEPVYPTTGGGASYTWDPKTGQVYNYTPPLVQQLFANPEVRDIPGAVISITTFIYENFTPVENYRFYFKTADQTLAQVSRIGVEETPLLRKGMTVIPDTAATWDRLHVGKFRQEEGRLITRATRLFNKDVAKGMEDAFIAEDVCKKSFTPFKGVGWKTGLALSVSVADYVVRKITKKGLDDYLAESGAVPDNTGGKLALLGGTELVQTGILASIGTGATVVTGAALTATAGVTAIGLAVPTFLILEEAHERADAELKLQTELATGKLYLETHAPTTLIKKLVEIKPQDLLASAD